MSDVARPLSNEEMAELSALADGTLAAERRAEVEARVAASPELRELVERQRRALAATQLLAAGVEPPASLRADVEDRAHRAGARRTRARRLAPRIAVAGAVVVAAAVVAAVVSTVGPAAPTVADAARLATQAPTGPPPASAGSPGTKLPIAVEGVPFPNFKRFAGWRAVGTREGRVDGRDATVVVYRKGGRRLGYAIVSGAALARPSAQATVIAGVRYQTVRVNDRLAVTWRRGGHTCVLVGGATHRELLELASWPLTPRPR